MKRLPSSRPGDVLRSLTPALGTMLRSLTPALGTMLRSLTPALGTALPGAAPGAAPRKVTLSFERFEYKFWIPERLVDDLLRSLEQHLRCDDWAIGGQCNTSLYLDSPEMDFYQQHVEKAPDRFKLRIRAYGDPPAGPAFFEIKRKVKAVCLKRRAVVPMVLVEPILRGEPPPKLSPEEDATLEGFLYLMTVHRAAPTLLVTARRQAYTAVNADDGVRLTVDRDICYQPALGPSLIGDRRAWISLCGIDTYQAQASALIELKFRGVAPQWTQELVQRLGLFPCAFSKYVTAVMHHELGPEGPEPDKARAPFAWGRA